MRLSELVHTPSSSKAASNIAKEEAGETARSITPMAAEIRPTKTDFRVRSPTRPVSAMAMRFPTLVHMGRRPAMDRDR